MSAGSPPPIPDDYYARLGVPRIASKADIRKAHHKLAFRYHPDNPTTNNVAWFNAITEAYKVLSDDELRQQYDDGQALGRLGGAETVYLWSEENGEGDGGVFDDKPTGRRPPPRPSMAYRPPKPTVPPSRARTPQQGTRQQSVTSSAAIKAFALAMLVPIGLIAYVTVATWPVVPIIAAVVLVGLLVVRFR